MRQGEPRYAELGLKDRDLSDDALLELMVENPILIERPIVVNGDEGRDRQAARDGAGDSVGHRNWDGLRSPQG